LPHYGEGSDQLVSEPRPSNETGGSADEAQDTAYLTAKLPTRTRFEIRPQVFIPAVVVIALFVGLGALAPDAATSMFKAIQGAFSNYLGWLYMGAVTVFLLFVIWLAVSRHGRKRLGPDAARPHYSYLAWFSMLFSAGMGIGLLFFSVAEPVLHFGSEVPPWVGAEAGTAEAAREAMTTTFFHWGLHAWAIYIVVALALCYYAYRRGLPLALRSAFYPLLGDRIYRWPGDAIDVLAIVGTLFGVATSLGLGATQINEGLSQSFGLSTGVGPQIAIIGIITLVAVGSVVLGLNKGIRRLSLANVGIGGLLVLFVLVAGPTLFIATNFVENVGNYAANLPYLSVNPEMLTPGQWQGDWTLFYWGWWISWSPFVGMFVARISRGRTIREFIAGVLLVPTLVTFVVLSVFGETALFNALTGEPGLVSAAGQAAERALFEMLNLLPLATVTALVAIISIAIFFITSSDSGSLVDDIHASGGSVHPHTATRVFWGVVEGLVAAVLLSLGGETGLEALQQASIATGVPLAILLLAACWALVRAFKEEEAHPEKVLRSSEQAEAQAAREEAGA
jgi:choline/glycine/proline betaine transport protein